MPTFRSPPVGAKGNSFVHRVQVIWPLSPFISVYLLISSKIIISNSLQSTV